MGGAIGGGGGGGGGGEGGKVDEGEERCVVVRCIRIYEVSSSHRSRHLAAQRWQRRAIASESLKVNDARVLGDGGDGGIGGGEGDHACRLRA